MKNVSGRAGFQRPTEVTVDRDVDYWREKYDAAAQQRDEAVYQLRELARQVHLWAMSESGATDALLAIYGRFGELGESIPRSVARGSGAGCVYYARQPGDRVKIGWSTSFISRMQTLYVMPEDVLAVEPSGSAELESIRHQQFSGSRVTKGRELFHASPELVEHIAKIRASHEDPPYMVGVKACQRQ